MNARAVRAAALASVVALTLCAAGWCQGPGGAAAGEGAGYEWTPAQEPAPTAGSVSMLDIVGKLMVALLVAWGLVQALRWWQEHRGEGGLHGTQWGRHMRLEETLSLGPDGRLHLVEVAGRRLLLASREGVVAQLAELTEHAPTPPAYRAQRRGADGSTDELTVTQVPLSMRPVRPDVGRESESWEQRRGRLLRELQER
ncbi:MAG: flagellar biosynthetic protein FliO [Armatimonadota bacterium]